MHGHDLLALMHAPTNTAPQNRAQRRRMGLYARPRRLGNTHEIDHRTPWKHPPVMVQETRNRALARVGKAA